MKNKFNTLLCRGVTPYIAIILWFSLIPGYSSLKAQNIIYVHQSATGGNNGSSWDDAFTDLQPALDAATKGDSIWVAAGVYKPTKDKSGNDSPADNRTKTFQLADSVFLFGGFDGTESTLDDRDWLTNETILSGDLGTQDDNSDNSYYVVKGITNGYLNGFMAEGGNANGSFPYDMGGGIMIGDQDGGTPPPVRLKNMKVIHCMIRNNRGNQGGGAATFYCGDSIVFRYCTFINNTGGAGAGLGNWDTKAYITKCIFVDNVTDETIIISHWGGGIYNWGSGSKGFIINCTFIRNSSAQGGGIHDRGVGAGGEVKNCIFRDNTPNDIYASSSVTYNFTNQSGYTGLNDNIGGNPLLYEAGDGKFELNWASPCIDAGDPDPAYNDPDGSRNNMGAGHTIFSPTVDALISVIDTPLQSFILGEYDIWVKMVNLGTNPLTSVAVDWEVNGIPQPTYNWTGNLPGADTTEFFTIGSYTFNQGDHTIKSWTSIVSDQFHKNDTVVKAVYAFAHMDAGVVSLDEPDTLFTNEPLTDILISFKNYDADSTIKTIDIGWSVDGTPQSPYNWSGNLLPGETSVSVNIGSYSFTRGKHLLKIWTEKPNGFDYDDNNENDTLTFAIYSRLLDVGISALFKPTDPDTTGLHSVLVEITNNSPGTTLTSATVQWKVDGAPQTLHNWTGSLLPGESTDSVEIGTYNLASTGTYDFIVWTESPNSGQDDYHGNDTLHATINIAYPLSGTYTIGAVGCDFKTFTDAVDSLVNGGGVGGPVVFNVEAGTYNEHILLPYIHGSSSDFTITFQSASGDSNDVILTHSAGDYTVRLQQAKYIIFKNMTISSGNGHVITLHNSATYNQFLNNRIIGIEGASTLILNTKDNIYPVPADQPRGYYGNNVFSNNFMLHGSQGISITGSVKSAGLEITGNVLQDQSGNAIVLGEVDGAVISGNTIASNSTITGIYLNYCKDNFTIERNKILLPGGGTGIYWYRGSNVTGITDRVTNNFIHVNTSADNQRGILLFIENRNLIVDHNSVNITGNNSSSAAVFFTGMENPVTDLRNNIFSNKAGGVTIYNYSFYNVTSDYNCLFTTGPKITYVSATLENHQNNTKQDLHSFSVDPRFLSDDDLHTFSPYLNNQGTPIADISVDIDGEARDVSHPDIGADEYDPLPPLSGTYDIGPSALLFNNFNEAVDSLIQVGVGGPVIFEVEDGTYDEQVTIPWIANVNETNSVTFRSAGEDSSKVIITHTATSEDDNYTLKLDGADCFTFKQITLAATGTEYARIVSIGYKACYNSFLNNQFLGVNNKSELVYAYRSFDTSNVYTNNLFSGGMSGIHLEPAPYRGYGISSEISGNEFYNQTVYAIYLKCCNYPVIKANTIYSDTKITGIYITECMEQVIIGNNQIYLNGGGRGIEMFNNPVIINDTSLIYNNHIYLKTDPEYGIFLDYNVSRSIKIVYNSVHLRGNNSSSICFTASESGYIYLKNNILVNKAFGKALGWTGGNYNDLYSNGTNLTNNSPDLEDWQGWTGLDLNSLSVDPYFENDSSYHILNPYLKGAGSPVAEVLKDIDGELRNAVHPDIGADEFTLCNSPISGTFTIGGTTPDYETMNDAVEKLVCCGVNGPVTFNIATDTLTEQISIQEIPGASETNTITFQSASGDSTDVLITYTPLNTEIKHTIQLNGADYLIFKNLSISSGEDWGWAIHLKNEATHNQFLNNRFFYGAKLVYSKGSRDSSNVFISNVFDNSSYGIYIDGNGAPGPVAGIEIKNNSFTNIHFMGVSLNNHNNIELSGNQFNVETGGYEGAGIYIAGSGGKIFNNFVLFETSSDWGGWGMNVSGSDFSVCHNTVKISGTSIYYHVTFQASISELFLFNNILLNMGGGRVLDCDTAGLTSDYNLLYTNGSILVRSSKNYANLTNWQAASGRDLHSISKEPKFLSETDLHTSDPWLNNIGTPLAEITTDIDGESRDPEFPDIGADEFFGASLFAGEYTIGPSGDYLSFTEAVDAISPVGLKEPVTFIVESGTYNEQLVIPGIPDVSATSTVTFRSESGDSTDVVLEFKATASHNYTVKLDSTKYITLENMTFKALDSTYANIIEFTNGATSNVLANNIFEGIEEKGMVIYSSGSQDNDNLIKNNLITGGNVGIYMLGESGSQLESGLMIEGNQFNNQYTAAVYMKYQDAPVISGNSIIHSDPVKDDWVGIFLVSCSRQYTSMGLIANNNISFHAEAKSAGIAIDATSWQRIYYNSVNIFGTAAESRTFNQQNGGGSNYVTNNIFSNQAQGLVIYTTDPGSFASDYNDYYANGSNFIYYNDHIPDLQTWQSTYSKDLNSYSTDPEFMSDTDLHIVHPLLNGSGTPIAVVGRDMDGETRDPVRPDIGADEFTEAYYSLTMQDTSICNGAQIEIDAGAGYDSYLWNTGETTHNITVSKTGPAYAYYRVSITHNTYNYVDSVKVTFVGPVVNLGSDETYCTDGSILLDAGAGVLTYLWSDLSTGQTLAVSQSGQYFVTVTDANSCTDMDTVSITINALPHVTIIQETGYLRIYDPSILVCQWYLDNNIIDMATAYSYTPVQSGDYFVFVTDGNSCSNYSDTVHFVPSLIETLAGNGLIDIYPNPATGSIYIRINGVSSPAKLFIFNSIGSIVHTEEIKDPAHQPETRIDLTELPQGTYFVAIQIDDQRYVRKVIVE